MRIVVTGASGNVGTSLLASLELDPAVSSVLGVARRLPPGRTAGPAKVAWAAADVGTDDLVPHFREADAVVHLAWLIQPSHDEGTLRRANVVGSPRVFHAAAAAGVGAVVHASSVGAYAAGPKDRRVDESWPTTGVPTLSYSRQKAAVERLLDDFEGRHPEVRVVRLRPGLVLQRAAAAEIRRYFFGPFFPGALLRRRVPVLPVPDDLVFQVVHASDAGRAFHLAATSEARGAFNVAADPVVDPALLARVLGGRHVAVPAAALRAAAAATWALRLQPAAPGWLDLIRGVPLMDTARARRELGWEPRQGAQAALSELVGGLARSEGAPLPPLEPKAGGLLRWRELLTGVGGRSGA